MPRVITFSRTFPAYHREAGKPTFFVEKVWLSLIQNKLAMKSKLAEISREHNLGSYFQDEIFEAIKHLQPKGHTIRAGNRWKAGDIFSPRVWSGKPYNSPQIQFAPDMEVKKVWDISGEGGLWWVNGLPFIDSKIETLANNDGLSNYDFLDWFQRKPFSGQIICWSESIEY